MLKADVPFDRAAVDARIAERKIDLAGASIREMTGLVTDLEERLKHRYLRMEFGIPGLEPLPLAIEAEIAALRRARTAATYSPIGGLSLLKEEGSKFLKKFLDIEIPATHVVPTVGSMQGGFLAQAIAGRFLPGKDTILFIDPGFSVHRMQCRFLGLKSASVDLYDRATWLDQVEALCLAGKIGGILYSSPNNPTWVILTDAELKRIGEICTKYDVLAIEDAAYFGMDFRRDYAKPDEPPYPPTVARSTDNYILLLSSSKIFSYAGQRIALAYLSPKLCAREFPALKERFGYTNVLDAFVLSGLYCSTSSVPQAPQHALAALLAKVNRGEYDFLAQTSEYADRAKVLRAAMLSNGFQLVYADDLGEPLSNGFYFTFSYPGFTGGELVRELLYYGISATTLAIAGSSRTEGVRGCVSLIGSEDFKLFEARVKAFGSDHPATEGAPAEPLATTPILRNLS